MCFIVRVPAYEQVVGQHMEATGDEMARGRHRLNWRSELHAVKVQCLPLMLLGSATVIQSTGSLLVLPRSLQDTVQVVKGGLVNFAPGSPISPVELGHEVVARSPEHLFE